MKISAFFSRNNSDHTASAMAMAETMRLKEMHSCNSFSVGNWGGIGYVETFEQFSAVKLSRQSRGKNRLLVAGVPLDIHGSLNERLDRVIESNYRQAAEELSCLDGAFAALFWDEAAQKLLIVTDPLGLQPLYLARDNNRLLIASELKAFTAGGLMNVEMDPAGWGAFIGFRFPIGNRTQLAGVYRVEPALQMVYDPDSGSIESTTYWRWPELRTDLTPDNVDTNRLMDSLEAEMQAYSQHASGGTVLLSGGFDSRLTLAMLKQSGRNPNALTLAHQDELWGEDGRLAVRTAKNLNVPLELIKTPRSYYNTHHYLDYAVMNEVATPSLYLFIAQVSAYLRPDLRVIWDGTPLGYGLVPAFLPAGGFDVLLRDIQEKRESYIWQSATKTFGEKHADRMYEAVNVLIKEEIAKYPDDEQGVTQFEVMNRMRNRTVPNCLKVYANMAMPFVPAVSRGFWDHAGAIPYSVSREYFMYHDIFRRYHPEVATIPFLSGGGLWCDPTMGLEKRFAVAKHGLAKSRSTRLMRKAFRRWIRGSRLYWTDSCFLPQVRERLEMDSPDIDADGIRGLSVDTRMPFYWQLWRWIMKGELTTWNSKTFLSPQETEIGR